MFLSVIIPVMNEAQMISLILFSGTILLALATIDSSLARTCETAKNRDSSSFEERMPSRHLPAGERLSTHR
jgi:hypothetical protein